MKFRREQFFGESLASPIVATCDEETRNAADLRRFEEAEQRAIERKRFDDLIAASTRWKQSQTLREYLEAVKRKYLDRHRVLEPGSEMAQWLEWASRQADSLDPLTDSPPSILDEEDHDARHRQRW